MPSLQRATPASEPAHHWRRPRFGACGGLNEAGRPGIHMHDAESLVGCPKYRPPGDNIRSCDCPTDNLSRTPGIKPARVSKWAHAVLGIFGFFRLGMSTSVWLLESHRSKRKELRRGKRSLPWEEHQSSIFKKLPV